MPETLESSLIRHLILKAKPTRGTGNNFTISDIVQTVGDMAIQKGLIKVSPNLVYSDPLADKITAVIWELIIEGVYTPGAGMQAPNLPSLRITEYGQKCFEEGELTAHDPDDYLRRLKIACPRIGDITLLYTAEALDTFRVGNYLASTVMIGVAAEDVLLQLVDAVQVALSTTQRQADFKKATTYKSAKKQHDEVLKRLKSPASPLPHELESVLNQHLDGAYDLIRRTRNDAGHPTGRRMERAETHALLLLFPTYCKTVHDLIAWLLNNQI